MPTAHIPADVWTIISDKVVHPKLHIALSQICASSRSIYEDEDKWKLLCRSIGVGRGSIEKSESWKKVFIEVVMHQERCKLPQCYQFGVPPMNAIGDLLPSSEATLQHIEYFKQPQKCSCGKANGHQEAHQASEDGTAAGGADPAGPAAQTINSPAITGLLNSIFGQIGANIPGMPQTAPTQVQILGLGGGAATFPLGTAPPATAAPTGPSAPTNPGTQPPPVQYQYIPLSLSFAPAPAPPGAAPPNPVAPTNSATQPQPQAAQFPLFGLGNTSVFGPAPVFTAPAPPATAATAPAAPSGPIIQPNLLPLSYRNRDRVPKKPILHPFIAETGSIEFGRFLAGETALLPMQACSVATLESQGLDWSVEDAASAEWKERNYRRIEEHPLLTRAFATNPPVAEMKIMIQGFKVTLINRDGVTVKDVIYNLNRYLEKPLSKEDHDRFCRAGQDLDNAEECLIEDCANRFAYLAKKQLGIVPSISDPAKNGQCWFRAAATVIQGGDTVCVMTPG
ncbi:uncharacterized protein MKK02DRAFT_43581 [Dioszegia hungarica]|uniref:DUF6699 domain-containing protein n=1 Tax=Dioszegia hungarica TaxID=4972 RepID=A0AA38HC65_9TREE|nr:uncharacterized protein MKK02DRAFT_43581 [Dioszegia hungarica]KAI9637655.1 hypothetical protein MKK02DRAFT_43581 [Dioszegia hungarica]